MMYFHHQLTLLFRRHKGELGIRKPKREGKEKKSEPAFHSFIRFILRRVEKATYLYLSRMKLRYCLSVPFSPCGKKREEQTLTPKDTKFQSTDSWVHNEILGCSHFLPLFRNELIGPGGCKPSATGLYRRKCFPSLLGPGYCLATSLYLTESSNVKIVPRVYKIQPLGPSLCLCLYSLYLMAERGICSF